ncbi:MAG: NAD(P)-binding protein [Polyangiaceae bacterium]|nr:NAD(P)-binding protein [Polyangiaceae bacterium]
MRIVVIGGGVAGTAAAWFAARGGAQVTLFDAGAGASALTSGAVDLSPWETAPAREPLDAMTTAFVEALGLWRVDGDRRAWVCTGAGIVRAARGRDASVLDVGAHAGARVGVARVPRDGWDADALALALSDEPAARRLGVTFVAVDVEWLHAASEATLPSGDFAALLDDAARVGWAAARVEEARRRDAFDALLVGPWLGAEAPRALALSRAARIDVGEVLSPLGGPAGERLLSALASVLTADVERSRAHVTLDAREGRVIVRGASGDAREFDACVLAPGGVGAGAIALIPPDPTIVGGPPASLVSRAWPEGEVAHCAPSQASAWRAETPLPPLQWSALAGSPLERAGLLHDGGLALSADRAPLPNVAVAGDHAHGVARTLLGAVASAARAVTRLTGPGT